jgi:hypothetical protein
MGSPRLGKAGNPKSAQALSQQSSDGSGQEIVQLPDAAALRRRRGDATSRFKRV